MKKPDEVKMVEKVIDLQKDMNALTQDKVVETAPAPIEPIPQEMSLKTRAELEGARYIEPKRTMPALGTLPDKLKKEHARDWEYVKGMYENFVSIGESVNFWFVKYPGDKYCLWEVPANTPVYVPRMIAKHLEEIQKYHTFNYVPKEERRLRKSDTMDDFAVQGTHYRGKFRPIGAFA